MHDNHVIIKLKLRNKLLYYRLLWLTICACVENEKRRLWHSLTRRERDSRYDSTGHHEATVLEAC